MTITVDGLAISVVRHGGDRAGGSTPVLYVHGGTFPAALAVGWRFDDGRSWADDLVDAGHDLWSFDFAGYGGSDRYPAMAEPPQPGPIGSADVAIRQLAAVVSHIRAETGAARVALLAHSWGGHVALRFAVENKDVVEALVLFAPVLSRSLTGLPDPAALPSWAPMPLAAQWKRFREDVPPDESPALTDAMFELWGEAYLATDPGSASRTPPAVALPTGPQADIIALWSGRQPLDLSPLACPVSIVRGAWDSLCTDDDIMRLRAALPPEISVRDAKLEGGTHLMHLETGRRRLWAATRNALARILTAPLNTHGVLFEVRPTEAGRDAYLALAASLRPSLDEVDGFGSIDRYRSRRRPEWILSLQTWSSDAAIAAWRSEGRHHAAQVLGRTSVFEDYRLRVGRLVRDSRAAEHRQPQGRSSYRADPETLRRYLVVTEFPTFDPDLTALLASGDNGEIFDSLYTPGRSAHIETFDDQSAAMAAFVRLDRVSGGSEQTIPGVHVRLYETIRDYGMVDRAQAPQFFPSERRSEGEPA